MLQDPATEIYDAICYFGPDEGDIDFANAMRMYKEVVVRT